jgi:hypothetical protein
MHTLGNIQHNYHNDIASITAEGVYPRLVTNPNEDKSIAINGNHQWLFENWQQVTVNVLSEYQQANFLFNSKEGELFHEINLTGKSHWDCFECMLRIFENTSTESIALSPSLKKQPVSRIGEINRHITQVAKVVNREIIRGKKVICSIPLAGTSVLKDLEFKSLMTQFGTAILKKQHSRLTLNAQAVSYHEIERGHGKFITTLFNAEAQPLLSIQSV